MWRLADQNPLNKALKGKVCWLDWRFNTMTWHFMEGSVFYKSSENFLAELLNLSPAKALKQSRIIHFTTEDKPWKHQKSQRISHPNRSFCCYTLAESDFDDHERLVNSGVRDG